MSPPVGTTAGSSYFLLTVLAIPAIFLAARVLTTFPVPPEPVQAYPSLSSLPPDSRSWIIYPEDYYAGGNYVEFPMGRVRYWLIGPEDGEKLVLINGLSVPALIWKDVAPQLATQGFRVLLYDLYGRGYSDAPKLPYNASLYSIQLALLMQHVGWKNAHIAGVSMGGGIAAAFTGSFPLLVKGKVALIASAGLLEASDFSRTSKFMSAPLLQYFVSSAPARLFVQKIFFRDSPSPNPAQEIVQIQSAHLPGFNLAIASSLRDGPVRGLQSAFSALSSPDYSVLLIWGTRDNTVPYRYAAHMQQLIPNSTLITIEGGHHDLTLSHGDLISSALVDFYNKE